jgi:hypothetical protein
LSPSFFLQLSKICPIYARVASSKKLFVHISVDHICHIQQITENGFVSEKLTPNQHGSVLQMEMPLTVLPNIKNEQLFFVMLDFQTVREVQ